MVPTLLSKKKVEFTGNVTDFPQLITNQNSTITVEERYAYARQQSLNRPSYSQTLNNKKRKPTTLITPPIHHSEEYRQCLFPPPCRTPVRSVINSPSQQMETEESQVEHQKSRLAAVQYRTSRSASRNGTEKLTNAANIAIPKTSTALGKKKFVEKPCWWDEECNEYYRLRGTALREYRNQATDENFYNYKKTAAKMRRITRRKRKQSFIQFTKTLNRDTPIGHIWNVVRKFARSAAGENRHDTENENWIADLLNSLTPPYIPENNNRIVDTNQEQSPLFTVEELMVDLEKKKETAPGTDQISYSMIKKLPENMIIKLVHFGN
ncbi:hypothetical protein JTB14_030452 [Gonioctena quinquepunctata]|nr:hypothetical protein JTB14_030452 [Gonioctena quinquepunctata]